MKISLLSQRFARMKWRGSFDGHRATIVSVRAVGAAPPCARIEFDTREGKEYLLYSGHSPERDRPVILFNGSEMRQPHSDMELLERFLYGEVRMEYSFRDWNDVPHCLKIHSRFAPWLLVV